jgi:dUTP pyrophosphatase
MNEKELLDELGFSENDPSINYDEIIDEFGLDMRELIDQMGDYHPKMEVNYTTTRPELFIEPEYVYESDSGFDLRSTEELTIKAGERALVPTGLCFDIPDGYEIQVRSKSGLALNEGLMVLNSPGTVDSGYQSEIKVILFNTSKNDIQIKLKQKIAQAVLCPVVNGKWVNLIKVDNLKNKDRNSNGFGSTGL